MPRISKIRLSNVKVDNGNKIIGDKTFNLYGNNSLFLLENGGGKSSIIQLIHQVILPNHKMQGREMIENVSKGSTVHVAVEWIPDDEYRSPFVTGFCFQNTGDKRKDNDRPYKYFTYIIEYDYENALRIEDIPFSVGGVVTSYSKLRERFQKAKGIQIFDTVSFYQNELEAYGILASEWKNISVINSEEGGVTDFFDNTATTQRLVEKLLIPSLLDNLYQTDEEKNSIINSFKKYKDSLMELPDLRRNLQDYNIINSNSDQIIDACKEYNQMMVELEQTRTMLTRLYVTLLEESKTNKKLLAEGKSELDNISNTKNTLNWRIQSYNVYKFLNSYRDAKKVFDEIEEKFEKTDSEIKRLQIKEKEQLAARSYEDYTKNQAEVSKMDAELTAFQMSTGERQKELVELRETVSKQYRFLFNQYSREEVNEKTKQAQASDKIEELKTQVKDVTKQKEKIGNQKAVLNDALKKYRDELFELKEKMLSVWQEDAPTTEKNLSQTVEQLTEEIQDYSRELENLGECLKKMDRVIHTNGTDQEKLQDKLTSAQDDFETFVEEENRLMEETFAHLTIQPKENLFVNKDQILFKLEHVTKLYEDEIIRLSIQMNHYDQVKKVIEQKGYHIHSELESVKEYLTQKDIDVVLGVEWITKVIMNEEMKRELLKKNPLLPVSILVEDSQMTKVTRALEKFPDELSIPVILLDKAKMDEQKEKEPVFSIDASSYIFHHFNVRLKEEDWEQYLEELEDILEDLEEKRADYKEKLETIQTYKNRLFRFWKQYHEHSRSQLSQEIKNLSQTTNELKELGSKLVKEKEKQEKVHQQIKTTMQSKQEEEDQLKDQVRTLSAFIKRYSDIEEVGKQAKLLEEKYQHLLSEINEIESNLEALGGKYEKTKERIQYFKGKLKDIKRDFAEYQFQNVEVEIETTESNYNETKEKYKVFREEFSADVNRIGTLTSTKINYQSLVDRATEGIKKNGFSIVAFAKLNIEYEKSLLNQIEFELEELKGQLEEERDRKDQAKEKVTKTQTLYEGKMQEVEETFNKEIYEYDLGAEAEFQLVKSELALVESNEQFVKGKADEISKLEIENRNAIEDVETTKDLLTGTSFASVLQEGEWNKNKPVSDVRRFRKQIQTKKEKMFEKRNDLTEKIRKLNEDVKKSNNASLLQLTYDLSKIIERSKDNYEEVISTFVSLLEAVKKFEDSIELRKKEIDERSEDLIEEMYERAETFYKNIMEIPKSSQIEEKGEIVSLFTIYWPRKEASDSKRELERFIDGILEELVAMKNKNMPEEEMDKVFEKKVNMINILNCHADISKCHLKALKNRNELLERKEYFPWGEVSKWSGGEKHATRISMFLALLNHLRKKKFAKEDAWKFVILDNPFGAASSNHVVKPMILLAKKTRTQLFCLTGIKEKSIQKEFDTVISNQYVLQRGLLMLATEEHHKDPSVAELDSIFYVRQN